jgi:hypothetical protein
MRRITAFLSWTNRIYDGSPIIIIIMPVPVAARSKAKFYGRSTAAAVGSNPPGEMDVCLLYVLSGRDLCDELITRPEESYRLWRVVCDQETL